jgi:RNA polymerase sigma factor (sigma-70 family)
MRDARDALDRELLARDEIDELLAGYVDTAFARCRARLGGHGDDAAQAVCERLWRELKQGKHRDGRVPFRVVVHKVIDWVCAGMTGTTPGRDLELEDWDGPDPGDLEDDVVARLDMEAFVASLPPGDGEVARLRILRGREIEEIAAELGMKRNAVDQALHRVRTRLVAWLED